MKYFPIFWMAICSVLLITTMVFTDGGSRFLNSITFVLQIFLGYMWYAKAVNEETEKQATPPPKKFTIKR